jgi:carbamate kinase
METPKPMQGTWTLTAPDGVNWCAESPIACLNAEQSERVPASVALARLLVAASEPDFAERHVRLGKFYAATDTDDLIDKMETHITRLQDKVAALTPKFSFAPQIVREV